MICFPLDNTPYTAEALGAWLGTRTRGVFSAENHFAVSAAGGLQVAVSGGLAWLQKAPLWGCAVYEAAESTLLTLQSGDGALNRKDAICLRLDMDQNTATLTVKQGEYAAEPAPPAPERSEHADEIVLAVISVPAGTVEITPELIFDTRADEALCGLMRDGVTGIPTAQLQKQAEALIAALQNAAQNAADGTAWLAKALHSPAASAALTADGTLQVTSAEARLGTAYPVQFALPEGYVPVSAFVLDGEPVQITAADNTPTFLAGAAGAVVGLVRCGSAVYPLSGGSLPCCVGTGSIDALTPTPATGLVLVRK